MLHVQHNCTKIIDGCIVCGMDEVKKNLSKLTDKIWNAGLHHYWRQVKGLNDNQTAAKPTTQNSAEWGQGYSLLKFAIDNEDELHEIFYHEDCSKYLSQPKGFVDYFLNPENWDKFKLMERCHWPFNCNKLFLLRMYFLYPLFQKQTSTQTTQILR